MDNKTFLEKWEELEKEAKEKWNLSESDFEGIKKNKAELVAEIQNRYKMSKEQAEKEINEWLEEMQVIIKDKEE